MVKTVSIRRALTTLVFVAAMAVSAVCLADQQQIAPGTAPQNAVVINTGADGICNSMAAEGDIQAAPMGQGTPNQNEIRCGADKIVSTAAAGDDRQLVAVGAACKNVNTVVVDTGDDGVANTTAAGDDTQVIAVGTTPTNSACVIAGANGIADTSAVGGDDVQVLAVGTAAPNTDVILCGPNGIADTTANNVNPLGDDVQVIAPGAACTANQVVVNSGPNGVADTRAEGPDLVITGLRPIKLNIRNGNLNVAKTIKVRVSNVEFGASAPVSRGYRLVVSPGSCGNAVISQVDSDIATPGLQVTANVPFGGRVTGSFVVTFKLQNVLSVSRSIPVRCSLTIQAQATDVSADLDDAANVENNETDLAIEVYDFNDRI